jgi:hypothetical protein
LTPPIRGTAEWLVEASGSFGMTVGIWTSRDE